MKRLQHSEADTGICRRRSPRLHSQIHAGDDGPTVACRRSTRLHLKTHTSDAGARVIHRRRRHRRGTLLENNEDMLWEILLRLPPQPSSLLRASAVCKRWRRVATDPQFLRCFRAHHQKPPLLGLLVCGNNHEKVFHPVLDPPDRIPLNRFTLGDYSNSVLSCRHGRVLLKDWKSKEVVVCDPITGEQHRTSVPPEFDMNNLSGAVLCATSEQEGHMHGSCHSSPFKVVMLSMYIHDNRRPLACVFSSETGKWGNLISIEAQSKTMYGPCSPNSLVGNVLYWLSRYGRGDIVEFDLEGQNLTLIKGPRSMNAFGIRQCQIIQTNDSIVAVVILSYHDIQVWQREVNYEGVSIWVSQKTVALNNILKTLPQISEKMPWNKLLGYDEDTNAIFLYMHDSAYMVQLKSMHSTKLDVPCSTKYYPFTSFYLPGEG